VSEEMSVVIDNNWRWVHQADAYVNCYDGDQWSSSLCPDVATCAKNCAVEGIAKADYAGTYGITTSETELNLKLVMPGNVGSRLYLMANETTYKMLHLNNREFSFDVDVSKLPCGVNGAVYFVQMDADGGLARYPGNEAGARYGTGYCDAQCPHDAKFINGEPNILDWGPIPGVPDSGEGRYGTCCVEMDIWEANQWATAYTAHSCSVDGQTRCDGIDCGDGDDRYKGVCDKDGCDIQTYRLGETSFYGPGSSFTLDSSRPFTLVTQFITADGTDDGELVEIRRHYKQDGKRIDTPTVSMGSAISEAYCEAELAAFGGNTTFTTRGGMGSMSKANQAGMVLVLSVWDDPLSRMLWLDSTQPANSTKPGAARGPCSITSGKPSVIEQNTNTQVTFSNIKFGDIGSTDAVFPPQPPAPPAPPPSPPPPGGGCAKGYAQCGGQGYVGPTCCAAGFHCVKNGDFWSQCMPSTVEAKQAAATAATVSTVEIEALPAAAPRATKGTMDHPVFSTGTRHSKVAI